MVEKEKTTSEEKIAVILVRGLVGVKKAVKDTLSMLHLRRKNHCVVIRDNAVNMGMLNKIKDYVTWGKISEKTFDELLEKRGEEWKGRISDTKGKYLYTTLEYKNKKYKLYFRLNPPRKGFGRKGIKIPFKVGGALGDRGDGMNNLIERML